MRLPSPNLLHILAISGTLPAALLLPCPPVRAQDPGRELLPGDVVVVTARLRPERLLDVPLAVSVVSGADMAARDLHTIEDLSTSIPALSFRANASAKDRTIYVRGIGTTTTSAAAEPSVSTVLDGVVLVRGGQQSIEIGDIQQVEVLRGPQGTLFGKNASAGVINITTAEPSGAPLIRVQGNLSTDNEQRVQLTTGGTSGPGGPDFRLHGLWTRFGGNVRNLADGDMLNGYERVGARAKLHHAPDARFGWTIAADYLHERDTAPYGVYADAGRTNSARADRVTNPALAAALAGEGVIPSTRNRDVSAVDPSRVVNENGGVSVRARWRPGAHDISAIIAWRRWRNGQVLDLDGRAGIYPGLPGTSDEGDLAFEQISQEMRLTSPAGGRIEYVVGAYFLRTGTDESYRRDVSLLSPDGAPDRVNGVAQFTVDTRSAAIFGETTSRISPALTLNAGARLVRDVVRYDHARQSSLSVGGPGIRAGHASSGEVAATDVGGRMGIGWQVADGANLYGTVSRGYKGPGFNVFFNMGPYDEAPIAPERSTSYEAGLKGEVPIVGASYSLTAFLTRFDGYQASVLTLVEGTPAQSLVNAGKVSSRGIEGDMIVRPLDGVSVGLNIAWTEARVDAFRCSAGVQDCLSSALNGARLPYAPALKLHGTLDYIRPITSRVEAHLSTDATYTSRTQYQLYSTPDTIQPAFTLWNVGFALRHVPTETSLRLTVHNILDRNYSNYLAGSAGGGLFRTVPRGAQRRAVVMLTRRF